MGLVCFPPRSDTILSFPLSSGSRWEGGGGLWPILLEFGPGLLDFNLILLPKSLAFVFVSHVRRVSFSDSAVHGVMILAVLAQDPIKP